MNFLSVTTRGAFFESQGNVAIVFSKVPPFYPHPAQKNWHETGKFVNNKKKGHRQSSLKKPETCLYISVCVFFISQTTGPSSLMTTSSGVSWGRAPRLSGVLTKVSEPGVMPPSIGDAYYGPTLLDPRDLRVFSYPLSPHFNKNWLVLKSCHFNVPFI